MTSHAYYNEIDPKAAAWLRELIKRDLIAPGDVDERSIESVSPDDLRNYTQCHFFAGIGVWSYALRNAGWPDDRPVWTGSCPCPSFSTAGKGTGFNDPRHLWPAWFRLIRECRPSVVFGEQVDAAIRFGWLDLIQHQMESQGYAVGKAVLSAAGVGAPHIRKRLFFVAASERNQEHQEQQEQQRPAANERERRADSTGGCGATGGLGIAAGDGWDSRRAESEGQRGRLDAAEPGCTGLALGDTSGAGCQGSEQRTARSGDGHGQEAHGPVGESGGSLLRGFWRDAEWLYCRDGKYRPVEPGVAPLAHGSPARVGRLRGYGNAIVAPCAQTFIESYLETLTDGTRSISTLAVR